MANLCLLWLRDYHLPAIFYEQLNSITLKKHVISPLIYSDVLSEAPGWVSFAWQAKNEFMENVESSFNSLLK